MATDDDRRARPTPATPPGGPKFAPRSKSPWLILAIVLAFSAYQAWERSKVDQAVQNEPAKPASTRSKANAKDGTYAVTHIADGDTINLEGKHRLRLIGINCREIAHPDNDPPTKAEPWSEDALKFTLAATRGKSVRVEFDPNYEETDHYGRWLCWVYYQDGPTEKLLNEELVRAGLAFVYDDRRRFPYSESIYRRLKAAQAEARRAGRGIYSEE